MNTELLQTFCAFDPASLAEAIVPIFIFAIPIVAILTKHQQKMAELIHNSQNQAVNSPQLTHEFYLLRQEFTALRDMVNQQAIRLDSIERRGPGVVSPANQPVIGTEPPLTG